MESIKYLLFLGKVIITKNLEWNNIYLSLFNQNNNK